MDPPRDDSAQGRGVADRYAKHPFPPQRPVSARSRPSSAVGAGGGSMRARTATGRTTLTTRQKRPTTTGGRADPRKSSSRSAAELEADYLRLNAELEEQAATLLSEATKLNESFDANKTGNSTDFSLGDDESVADTIDAVMDSYELDSAFDAGRTVAARKASGVTAPNIPSDVALELDGGNDDVERFLAALADVGQDVQLRLLKAQLRTVGKELSTATAEAKSAKQDLSKVDAERKSFGAEKTKLEKQVQSGQSQVSKLKKSLEEASSELQTAQTEGRSLAKELDELKRAHKQGDAKTHTLQVRLNRAQEELDNVKRELKSSRQNTTASGGELRKKYDAVVTENKILSTQKEELVAAFKKQMQLIDILKRQKLHVEAARVLQFSEEEFVKTLDWGS
eukprot:m.589631 g.589631  ORF g.589631 m.589631 type:complete len:396 (+) comp22372_c0_seq4:2100-3287(+)